MQEYEELLKLVTVPFWRKPDFWIGALISLAGVVFAWRAFVEARGAKAAANEAGKTVKIQTITIELTELSQRLDKLGMDIRFDEARDLINETSRRLRRLISPFEKDAEFSDTITALRESLASANKSLRDVRPPDNDDIEQVPYTVYYGIEGDLSEINGLVADLLGLFEKRTISMGDDQDDS